MVALSLAPLSAHAATFTVNAWADADSDGSCDPLATSVPFGDDCTLRDAVDANARPGSDVVIVLGSLGRSDPSVGYVSPTPRAAEASCVGTPEDANTCGDIDVWDPDPNTTLTLRGGTSGTPTIAGSHGLSERLLHAVAGSGGSYPVHLLIEDVDFTGGNQVAPPPRTVGGGCIAAESTDVAIEQSTISGCTLQSPSYSPGLAGGGAIFAGGDLTLLGSNVSQNDAVNADGGAIDVDGNLTITDSVVNGNKTLATGPLCRGGAIFGDESTTDVTLNIVSGNGNTLSANRTMGEGGAVWLDVRDVTIEGSTFAVNEALDGDGGALYINARDVSITDTFIDENQAAATGHKGGGAYIVADSLFMDRVTVDSNVSEWDGAGFWVDTAELRIEDSEFRGNDTVASGSRGGGMYLVGFEPAVGAAVAFERSAFNENSAGFGPGLYVSGIPFTAARPLRFDNVTVGGNLRETSANSAALQFGGGSGSLEVALRHVSVLYNAEPASTVRHAIANDGNSVTARNTALGGECPMDDTLGLGSSGSNLEWMPNMCFTSGAATAAATTVEAEFFGALAGGPLSSPARGYVPRTGMANDVADPGVLAADQHAVPRPSAPDIGALEN